jgi:hypothetical protein
MAANKQPTEMVGPLDPSIGWNDRVAVAPVHPATIAQVRPFKTPSARQLVDQKSSLSVRTFQVGTDGNA